MKIELNINKMLLNWDEQTVGLKRTQNLIAIA
jgi:hypothetical protein